MTTTPAATTSASTEVAFDCPGNYVSPAPTALRCSKCNRPLAVKDAKRTPTGYVCPYFVKARVATFYNAGPQHYLIAVGIAFVLGILIGFGLSLVGRIGFFSLILTLFIGPAAGGLVAEAIRRVNGKNRGQYIWLVASIAMVVGSAFFTILPPLSLLLRGSSGFLFALIPTLGIGLAVSALIARMRF
jgi:hypothetical protein